MGGTSRTAGIPWEGPVFAPSNLSKERFYSIGALSANGLDCRFYKKAKYTFIRFLKVLRRKYGKVLLFVDNASYHRAALVGEQLAEWNGDVVPKFLPPYMLELNKIEGQWRGFKKATANRLYQTVGEMQKSIRVMLRRGEIKICQMSDYLG